MNELILLSVALIAVMLFIRIAHRLIDRIANRAAERAPYEISEAARKLHAELTVVDLHSDSLMWDRNLCERHSYGHLDFPRMREGNIALQSFTIVTKSPLGMNFDRTPSDSPDMCTALIVSQRRPVETRGSLLQRALFQAGLMHKAQEHSGGKFTIIKTSEDLDDFLLARAGDREMIAGFIGCEGMHCLEGNLRNVDELFNAGVRMMGPTHFFDNDVAGSAHGINKGGLTEFGKLCIKRMEELGMIVDLAHSSPKTIEDVLSIASRPTLVSHTGLRSCRDCGRNLSDDQIKAIAEAGGIIGITFFGFAVGKGGVPAIVRSIRHAVDTVGADHVALGSDFDGFVKTPFDAAGMALITDELLRNGFTEKDIRLIAGENVIRLLHNLLPRRQTD
ncbi:MAG TPA: dipeptidase [Candidatus Brocadiia bacterium]|nr:dipeptidase [Candidatus Brocadiia bacterium]